MKLNNKCFAITAILYTLFILFSLTLISIIIGQNSKNKMLEKSIEAIENKYNWDCADVTQKNEIKYMTEAEHRGKYIFINNNGEKCYTYLLKGTNISKDNIRYLNFTTQDCNNNKDNLEIKGFCPDTKE